jgi:hypothetical protein
MFKEKETDEERLGWIAFAVTDLFHFHAKAQAEHDKACPRN